MSDESRTDLVRVTLPIGRQACGGDHSVVSGAHIRTLTSERVQAYRERKEDAGYRAAHGLDVSTMGRRGECHEGSGESRYDSALSSKRLANPPVAVAGARATSASRLPSAEPSGPEVRRSLPTVRRQTGAPSGAPFFYSIEPPGRSRLWRGALLFLAVLALVSRLSPPWDLALALGLLAVALLWAISGAHRAMPPESSGRTDR